MEKSGPRVCIVGAGAIGTFIGARLSQSGCQVTDFARGATAASLRAHGFLLQDAEAGRPLEIDALLTAVTEIGERVGVPTPNTDALLGLVRVFVEVHHG